MLLIQDHSLCYLTMWVLAVRNSYYTRMCVGCRVALLSKLFELRNELEDFLQVPKTKDSQNYLTMSIVERS